MNRVALRIGLRELSGGLKGFWIYLACLVLGTSAIASSGSVTEVFTRGLAGEARVLLGGDAMFSIRQRLPTTDERAFINGLGLVTQSAAIDVMASAGERRQKVDVRAVDSQFPLIGKATLSGGEAELQTALDYQDERWGIVVSQSFLDAFELDVGDPVTLGSIPAVVRARVDALPDRIGTPGSFTPEALIHLDALIAADRFSEGQLFRSGFRVVLNSGTDFETVKAEFEEQGLDKAGIRLRSPADAVDGLQNLLNTLNSFLAIIGIAALVAGGVGVSQATIAFLDTRIESIAALKALGADSKTIRAAYLIQLGLLAVLGAIGGVIIGAATPYLLTAFSGDAIPLPQALGVYPLPLIKAFVLGVLAAAVFALPAIGRARATRPSALFRRLSDETKTPTPWFERLWSLAAAALLAGIAIATSDRPPLTAALLVGAVIAWGVFLCAAYFIRKLAKYLSGRTVGLWRLTLANLGGVGSLAPTIVPALGMGLALLTLVASVQINLLRQISETAPSNAPSLVFSQIPNDSIDHFDRILADNGLDLKDADKFRRAPFLLVRVMSLKGAPIVAENVARSERWVIRGETSVTYLADQPKDTVLTEGQWWAQDYAGPLLVSVEADAAAGLHIGVGDEIGFRVFGRDVTARVGSLRTVEWGSFSIGANTAFIFSPGTLEAAKPYHVAIAKTPSENETKIIDALGETLPDVIVFQTRSALATAAKLFASIAVAVNAAAGVVTIAGLLVLLGAFAAMANKRRSEAALLKVFGAKRGEILRLYAGEFAFAGGAGALIGAAIGVAGAYPIVTQVFEAQWTFPWHEVALVIGLAILISAIGGMSVGISTLARRPAQVLRSV
ncbi:MAG: oxidoreductase [Robiginitomaculum sp.]|nr:MAG: oxidoreductase [Robiginitomaculum sp.]